MDTVRPIRGVHDEQYVCFHRPLPHNSLLLRLLARGLHASFVSLSSSHVVFPISLIGSFTAGLSLCNQQTILFYLIPIILSIFITLLRTHQLTPRRFLFLVAALFLGLLPYAYLPIISFFPQIGNWGDMRSLKGRLSFPSYPQASSPSCCAANTVRSSSSPAMTAPARARCSSTELLVSSADCGASPHLFSLMRRTRWAWGACWA